MRAPNVVLPRSRNRWVWVAALVSVAVHVPIAFLRVGARVTPRRTTERVILVPLGSEGDRAATIAFERPAGGGDRRPRRTSGTVAQPRKETAVPAPIQRVDTVTAAVEPRRDSVTRDSAAAPERPVRRPSVMFRPALGSGVLWVRPLPLPPRELAAAITKSQIELVDSIVTAIVQVYMDSVLNAEPDKGPLPSWVTKVGDQQIGVDSRWIYLGPIKIPTALVAAFLPIGGGGGETADFTRFRQLQQIREDLQVAARRTETMDDFKKAVRELRVQREREREFAKNQRIAPKKKDSTVVKKDQIP